jgi:hypothetical protein
MSLENSDKKNLRLELKMEKQKEVDRESPKKLPMDSVNLQL